VRNEKRDGWEYFSVLYRRVASKPVSLSTESEELRRENERLKHMLGFPEIEGLIIESRLIESGQAVVYKGLYREMSVAIKVFKHAELADEDFRAELESLR
jgi:hypothetical protein